MTSDLKIEIFAYYLFHDAWYGVGLKETRPNILQLYGDECSNDNSYIEVCDELFRHASFCRRILFSRLYLADFTNKEAESWESPSDCYDYITRICGRDDLFGHLTVFERLFATSAFVLYLCLRIRFHKNVDVVRYGHIFWAMNFDEFTEAFYREGGWKKLKIVAQTYCPLSGFVDILCKESIFYLNTSKEASENYRQFKNAVQYDEFNHKITFSKQWIKFRLEHFESYIHIPSTYEFSLPANEADILLEDLKRFCSPLPGNDIKKLQKNHEGSNFSTKIVSTKIFDSSKKIKTTGHRETENFSFENSRRISHENFNILSNGSLDFENQRQSECKALHFNVTENLGSEEGFSEVEMQRCTRVIDLANSLYNKNKPLSDISNDRRFESVNEKFPKTSHMEINQSFANISLSNENEKNTERRNKIWNTAEILSTNQMDLSKWRGRTFPHSTDFDSRNETINSVDEIESSKKLEELGFHSKKGDRTSEISKTTDVVSTSVCYGKTGSYILPVPEDFNSVKRCVNICDEIRRNKKARDKSKEQDCHEMKNLLRMILVLDDRQGIEYVRLTLDSNISDSKSLQKISNKRKKRRK